MIDSFRFHDPKAQGICFMLLAGVLFRPAELATATCSIVASLTATWAVFA